VLRIKAAGATFYVVKAGDNLSVISAHTGVPLPTLMSLNPKVSSTALQVGQRVRLRR
jgi:LysM repeat protein